MGGTLRTNVLGIYGKISIAVATFLAAYHIYTSAFGMPAALQHRAAFIMMALVIGFLDLPILKKNKLKLLSWDFILVVLSIIVMGYIIIDYTNIPYRIGEPNTIDIIFGSIAVVLILIFARRQIGIPIIVLPVVCLLYTFFGQNIRGFLGHPNISIAQAINGLYLGTSGIFATPLGAASTYVVIFIIFGKFMEKTGLGDYFIKLSYSLVGRTSSGSGLTAVLASGFFGMISGSPPANVVTTGAFTIPLMKRQGFDAETAGAIEAISSTGGQIMPPVMGAAAFIICETLEIPYLRLVSYAIIPALIYYIGVGISVHLEAKKRGMQPAKNMPSIRETLKEGWWNLIPIAVLLFFLLIIRRSVFRSAIYSIVATVIISWFSKESENRINNIRKFLEILRASGKSVLTVAAATATAGIVIGTITITGLGLKIAIVITGLAGGKLIVALMLVWIVAVVLGMGLPTSAAYITTAALLAPSLVRMGVHEVVAHLFCLYGAIISNLTPPVCVASYTAAGISQGNVWETAKKGFLLGLPGPFIVPFMFALRPGVLMLSSVSTYSIIADIVCCVLASLLLSVSLRGFLFIKLQKPVRVLTFIAAFLLIATISVTNYIAIAILISVLIYQFIRYQKVKAAV
jgi:TRAP transporter 4TM/12TM fusion protein